MITGCAIIAAIPRFEHKLQQRGQHRLWQGAQTRGGKHKGHKAGGPYGQFWVGPAKSDTVKAHVFAAFLAGKIPTLRVPAGMHLDHCCENTLCVDCTELVIAKVNLERRHTRPHAKRSPSPL